MENKYRTKARIPNSLYRQLKILAEAMDIAVGNLLQMIVSDTIEYARDTKYINVTPDDKPRKWKTENNDSMDNFKTVNFKADNNMRDYIDEVRKATGQAHYSLNEFVIDSIQYQLENNFSSVIKNRGQEYITALRINHASDTHVVYKSGKEKNGLYSEDAKKKHPVKPCVTEYIKKKSEEYDAPKKAVVLYYATKEINRIIEKSEEERKLYGDPDYYDPSIDL